MASQHNAALIHDAIDIIDFDNRPTFSRITQY
jgi:hypothetical protein